MKLEKKIVIGITEEERRILHEIVDVIEQAFNIDVNECSEVLADVITGIIDERDRIYTSEGDIEIEYD